MNTFEKMILLSRLQKQGKSNAEIQQVFNAPDFASKRIIDFEGEEAQPMTSALATRSNEMVAANPNTQLSRAMPDLHKQLWYNARHHVMNDEGFTEEQKTNPDIHITELPLEGSPEEDYSNEGVRGITPSEYADLNRRQAMIPIPFYNMYTQKRAENFATAEHPLGAWDEELNRLHNQYNGNQYQARKDELDYIYTGYVKHVLNNGQADRDYEKTIDTPMITHQTPLLENLHNYAKEAKDKEADELYEKYFGKE